MSITINGLSTSSAQLGNDAAPVTVARNEATVTQQQTGRPLTTETVTLTDLAQELRSLEQGLRSQPVVDSQRVDAVKQALLNGKEDFNAERVAGKFIRFEALLAR